MARLSLPGNPAQELQRLIQEERATPAEDLDQLPPPTPPSIPENTEEASIFLERQKDGKIESNLSGKTSFEKDRKMLATEAISRVNAMANTPLKQLSLKVPDGLNERIQQHIGQVWADSGWRDRPDKQTLLKRALMLLCHELETGEPLVDFEGGKDGSESGALHSDE